jgi:hypothetical protein
MDSATQEHTIVLEEYGSVSPSWVVSVSIVNLYLPLYLSVYSEF